MITSAKTQELAMDKLLLERIKAGDEQAFNEMIEQHWERIYGVANRFLKNPEDAEEIAQDTFIRAHRNIDSFRGESSLATWLYQIASNLARNRYWYWSRRKRDMTVSIDETLTNDSQTAFIDTFVSDFDTPDDATVAHELVDNIAIGINKLKPKHREILTLRNIQHLSYEEIADKLGVSVGTVKSRIARARERLRKVLKKI